MSFATLEAKVNAAVFAKLANAMAAPSVGDAFPIVFDSAQGFVNDLGVVAREPAFEMLASASVVTPAQVLTISGSVLPAPVAYKVRAIVPLDEGGRQRVDLVRPT